MAAGTSTPEAGRRLKGFDAEQRAAWPPVAEVAPERERKSVSLCGQKQKERTASVSSDEAPVPRRALDRRRGQRAVMAGPREFPRDGKRRAPAAAEARAPRRGTAWLFPRPAMKHAMAKDNRRVFERWPPTIRGIEVVFLIRSLIRSWSSVDQVGGRWGWLVASSEVMALGRVSGAGRTAGSRSGSVQSHPVWRCLHEFSYCQP